jgi:glyoxylase-like metal-dependent hydrolase (beta-lactamase superfamily II)
MTYLKSRRLTRRGKLPRVKLIGVLASVGLLAASLVCSTAGAQGSNQASGPASTRLILLGTGGGPLTRTLRSEPANLLIVGGKRYLIDAGDGLIRQLTLAGVQPVQVFAVFITHEHLDHNADLGTLISYNWVQGRKAPLPIYGSGVKQLVGAALDYLSTAERNI